VSDNVAAYGTRHNVDELVESIYREAGDNPATPPGIGVLLVHFFHPVCHTRLEPMKPDTGGLERPGQVERQGDEWTIHLPCVPLHRRSSDIGYALARVLAHEAVFRARASWSDKQERGLADAIILPTPAILLWDLESVEELAVRLDASPLLVERRRRTIIGHGSSSRLRIAPIAKAAEVIDLAMRRRA
jgi:hypothetical protein